MEEDNGCKTKNKKAKPKTKFLSSEINAQNATELLSGKIQPECNKYRTDSANEKEQSVLDIIEISTGTTVD